MTQELVLEFSNDYAPLLFGEHNTNISYLEDVMGIVISDRGSELTMTGSKQALDKTKHILDTLYTIAKKEQPVKKSDIDDALRFWDEKPAAQEKRKSGSDIVIHTKKKTIVPRSPNQKKYLESILDKDMVFGIGPAGTGKTYLAVAVGVSMFLSGQVERLIFTRPAVEAGENLGFLPGDMREKIDPYLRPIYDAMGDMMPFDFMMKKMEAGEIEIAPLAFMRGRTLANAFVVLDEAQNTTKTQMKMFLTRMGENTRMVITGDMTQTDLPKGIVSGLRDATEILEGIPEVAFHHFTNADVVRHRLVARIVEAYDKHSRD
jgi:phosphate starvation-inducible PhoH-like protein